MHLSPVERLILLKLIHILEIIDPARAREHDADAEALELGTPAGLAGLFELIDLEPTLPAPVRPVLRLVVSNEPDEITVGENASV